MHWLTHLFLHLTGSDNPSGPEYGFWSGFGSDLGELAIVSGLISMYRRHNCAVHRCWRIGRHPVQGTPHVCCKAHAPGGAPTHEQVLDAHRNAAQRRSDTG